MIGAVGDIRGDEGSTVAVIQIARQIAPLAPSDTIAHAVEQMRQSGLNVFPVVGNGHLVAMVTLDAVNRYLDRGWDVGIDQVRLSPVVLTVSEDGGVRQEWSERWIAASLNVLDAAARFQSLGNPEALPVLDISGRYAGLVCHSDLVATRIRTLGPPRMGGMATPIGVYLTDGVNAGGAGTIGLMLTGVCLGLLGVVASIVGHVADNLLGLHPALDPFVAMQVWAAHQYAFSGDVFGTRVVDELRSLLPLPLILLFVRLVPLAGYHAAEHQVVHCTERGQALTIPMVRSMPRVHPRCGTNLVAGLMVFHIAMVICVIQYQSILDAVLPAALFTLFLWRPVGSFIQQYLTTRPASDKQILAGIAAAESLMHNYRANVSRQSTAWLRIWRMGIVQVAIGYGIVFGLLSLIALVDPAVNRFLL